MGQMSNMNALDEWDILPAEGERCVICSKEIEVAIFYLPGYGKRYMCFECFKKDVDKHYRRE